ncbi:MULTISPECIES: hypothetical protein [Okeania]|uniref:Uncharacterized protein n=1 Tax=Okeania hirsuta TaxID=1458930 RepID=A0A3N6P277_9CYAN|nr:hypothetical protein [Okeania sp. SIO4D6]NEP73887.1 hypothetical protein [Okeania sp. SIO2G5]NEP94700.1 hypothetical protein [Okeania sp. SIO2F5]NEQ92425.1 hypothetical protein [Okeania sp. SIO2G4]NES74536.1 hypothetical protein [Okeania sp. SIO1H4]NES92454.1 hypothetical protein [Okeania sp. SIO2B9]NET12295.1 hypothetical protein [Okeania sp. SIO1H6]NET20859.1 hypothetical protein [Okeania sp. SIO1H5]NET74715.1 hypothetical protein [Okeania sp. SIO1F9]NET94072.1 hypothetical protein [O
MTNNGFSHFFSLIPNNSNGFGASTFSPLLNVAKVLIPKSMSTEFLNFSSICGGISTTKLRKYLLAASLMTVTDDGYPGKGLDQTTLKNPIFAKYTLSSCT